RRRARGFGPVAAPESCGEPACPAHREHSEPDRRRETGVVAGRCGVGQHRTWRSARLHATACGIAQRQTRCARRRCLRRGATPRRVGVATGTERRGDSAPGGRESADSRASRASGGCGGRTVRAWGGTGTRGEPRCAGFGVARQRTGAIAMIIGVDIGTSLTKAVAYDMHGTPVARAETGSQVSHLDGGAVEQDMEQVIGTVGTVVREVAAGLEAPVTAVALTGQGDGLWLRDVAGNAVRPAISWLDARADSVLVEWQTNGVAREVFDRTGSGMFPGCAVTLLSYLDKHEPESLDRAAVAGYCVDTLVQRLTGEITVDVSNASLP